MFDVIRENILLVNLILKAKHRICETLLERRL